MTTIYSTISSGPDTGKRLLPHLHKDGFYVASTSRFEIDYVKVKSLEELEALIRAGYGARLKALDSKNAPSIIISANIDIECCLASIDADIDFTVITRIHVKISPPCYSGSGPLCPRVHMTIRVVPSEFYNAPTCYRSYRNHACIELL